MQAPPGLPDVCDLDECEAPYSVARVPTQAEPHAVIFQECHPKH